MALEICYASDVYPTDPSLISALTLFFDKVHLPHPYGIAPQARRIWVNGGMSFTDDLYMGYDVYKKWRHEVEPLFEVGVFEELPDLFDMPGSVPDSVGEELPQRFGFDTPQNSTFDCNDLLQSQVYFRPRDILDGPLAMALYHAYAKKVAPDFFWRDDLRHYRYPDQLLSPRSPTDRRSPCVPTYRAALALALLRYSLPDIPDIRNVEETLEIRARLENERKGLSSYLSELSGQVRDLVGPQMTLDEAAKWVAEAKVIPEFEQYARQEFTSKLESLGRRIEPFMEIDASLFSPKGAAQLLKAVVKSFKGGAEDRKETLTNSAMALKFLAGVAPKK